MSDLGRQFGGRNLAAKQTPEAREQAARAIKRHHLAWCPEEFWALNEQLRRKGFKLAERKDVILAEVPGTAQHARRQVLNHQTAQILRAEREKAQAY